MCIRDSGTRTATLAYVQKTLHLGVLLHATQDGQPEYARDERSGLLILALCLLRCNSAEELIQAPNTRPARSALSQHAVTLPASRFASHSIAPQTASACPGTFQHFFGASDQFGNMPQGRHTGIILEYRRNNQLPRQPILPSGRGPRTACTFAARAAPFFGGATPYCGSRSKRAYSSLSFRSFCEGHSVLPLPCENRRLSTGFYSDIRANRRFI